MSLFNLHCVTDTKFDVVNVEKIGSGIIGIKACNVTTRHG